MVLGYYIVPLFIALLLIIGFKRNSYDAFIKGAQSGIDAALTTFPYLLAMIFATKLLSSSLFLVYLFKNLDMPYLLVLEGFFRPLSNSASLSILLEIYAEYGADSSIGIAGSVLQGASETSFYIITIYYGAIGVKKYPYSFFLAIISDILIFCFAMILYYFIL